MQKEIYGKDNQMPEKTVTTPKESLLLKWGTLKGWDNLSEESQRIVQKYFDIGACASVMLQEDTPEQKEILCELIRQLDGEIQNDWDGEMYTKEKAIDYIKNYGKEEPNVAA